MRKGDGMPTGAAEEGTLDLTFSNRFAATVAGGCLLGLVTTGLTLANAERKGPTDLLPIVVAIVAFAGIGLALVLWACRSGVRIDSQGITERGLFGKRPSLPWPEIQKVFVNQSGDLELSAGFKRNVTLNRWYVGFEESLPLLRKYLSGPALTQLQKILDRRK